MVKEKYGMKEKAVEIEKKKRPYHAEQTHTEEEEN